MEKVWEIKNPDEYLKPRSQRAAPRETFCGIEKNPGRAYTLSLLFWGAGQGYNEEQGKSLAFNLLQIAFFVNSILAAIYGRSFFQFLRSHGASSADLFLAAELLLLCFLMFWRYNAGDAYHTAAKSRRTPFKGIDSRQFPFLCSLLVPGWGQFLNGQPLKGSFYSGFSILALLSFAAIPSTLVAWPYFQPSDTRLVIEAIFAVSVLYAPVIPFVWIFGSFDALRVSFDELKKEPLWERLKSANNRRRTQGWVRGLFPQIKSTIFLGLVLAGLLTVIVGVFPRQYYLAELKLAQAWMQAQEMTLVPDLIQRLLAATEGAGK